MELYQFYRDIVKIKDEKMIEDMVAISTIRHVPKKTVLYWGTPEDKYIYMVMEGITRAYEIDESGEEHTICFDDKPGNVIMASGSLKPEMTNIIGETLSEATIVAMTYENFRTVLKKHPVAAGAEYSRYLAGYLRFNVVKASILQKSARVRFEWFNKEFPGLIDTVNNHYIASYLGMTNITLSRVKNKAANAE